MLLHNGHKRQSPKPKNPHKVSARLLISLYLLAFTIQLLQYSPEANGAPTDLKVYAQAASFARLDPTDPNGWFYQAVLYNPTDTAIIVTGLRWWYNASTKIVDNIRDATCYDSRCFSNAPATLNPSDRVTGWEYAQGSISLTVPPKKMILTWIEVPTGSINNDAILTTYYVQAYAGGQWIPSPLYPSHSGSDQIASTIFRADFDLTTNPSSELQTHPNPQWLFRENRSVVAGLTSRVRLIPVTSSRNTNGIDFATVNVTMPTGWRYVLGSAYNPYAEAITYYSIGGKDRLKWNLNRDVIKYELNQSLVQNYIEFNVTAPSTPGIYNFTVTASITSFDPRTTIENQYIHTVVMSPPTASFTHQPSTPLVNQTVTFNASASSDPDGTIQSYTWDFGDTQEATGMIVSHAYSSTSNYTIILTVTDNDGLKSATSSLIRIIEAPTASFTFAPAYPQIAEIVTFNASSSAPNGGIITSYFWDFGDNNTGTGATATHAYSSFGNYTVVLNVTDSEGLSDTETHILPITAIPSGYFTYWPTLPLINAAVTFNASLSTPNGGQVTSYSWDFGDGTTDTGSVTTHAFTATGNYTITLTITDTESLTDIQTQIIRIGAEPSASFSYSPQLPWLSSAVAFNASSSHDSDGTITTYRWNFGDGNTTDTSNPIISHVYQVSGSFTANLTIFDNDGFTKSISNTITVVIHDAAILSVSPSATEAQAGQQVNITVVVKNKGTTTENFNVTIYYNNNKIETQRVLGLPPNSETTLTVLWNTTGLTPNSSYTLRAEISQITGETNTTDNTALTNVRILPQQSSPSDFWSVIQPYVIPVFAVIGSTVLLTVVTLRRRSNGKTANSIKPATSRLEPLVDAMGGELPEAFSVMIVGDASSGKSVLCQQLAYRYLNQEKPCIYITYDCFPDEIRKNMKSFGWNISTHEQNGNFVFVDCYSSIAGKTSQEKYSTKQAFSLSELGIAISTAMSKANQKSCRVFLDSTAPLFTRLDSAKVIEFLQDHGAQIRGDNGIFFFIVGKGTLQEDLRRKLEEIVDCIIDLDTTEEKKQTVRRIRVRKMRGRSFSDQWISFKIDAKNGLIPSTPKNPRKAQT
jgi:PKD repeat protein/KaiC/GvpD/RAD55 family RecA-like ATPase